MSVNRASNRTEYKRAIEREVKGKGELYGFFSANEWFIEKDKTYLQKM